MNPPAPLSHHLHVARPVARVQEESEDVPHWVEQEEEHDDPLFVPSILLDEELSPGAIRAAEEEGVENLSSQADFAALEDDWEDFKEEESIEGARDPTSFSSNVLFVSGPHKFVETALVRKISERLSSKPLSDEGESDPLDLDQLSFDRLRTEGHGDWRRDWRKDLKQDTVKLELKERKWLEDVSGWLTTWKNVGARARPPYREVDETCRTVELSDVVGFYEPPRSLHQLFFGMKAIFSSDINIRSRTLDDVRFFEDLFIAFGGSVMENKSDEVTHCFGCYSENNDAKSRGDDLSSDCVSLHPHWIALSVEHGLLLPTSLFELEPKHFLTGGKPSRTSGGSNAGLINSFVEEPYERTSNINHDTVLVLSPLPELPPSHVDPTLCGRRIFFDASETKWNGVALRAVKSAVERLGATVVGGVERADWVVADEPKGRAYSWARRRLDQLVLGTMGHLLAQIGDASHDLVDCFSNPLYFPVCDASDRHYGSLLYSFEVVIDIAYPFAYRRYLVALAERLGSRSILQSASHQPAQGKERKIIISDSCKTQWGRGRIALPKFLEDCFLFSRFVGNLGAAYSAQPFLYGDQGHAAPLSHQSVRAAEREPSRVPESIIESWNDVEQRWAHGDENPEAIPSLPPSFSSFLSSSHVRSVLTRPFLLLSSPSQRTWKSECCFNAGFH